jgi:hypothetical protein
MNTDVRERWPLDLKIFAALCIAWAAVLAIRVLLQPGLGRAGDMIQAVIFGYKFYGLPARVVLIVQASIYASFGLGILAQRRWALVLALAYMLEVIASHFVFVIANMDVPGQEIHVKIASAEGPVMVLIALYLWIRGRDLLFGE